MKTYGEMEAKVHALLTSAFGGGEWSDLGSGRWYLLDKTFCRPQNRFVSGGKNNNSGLCKESISTEIIASHFIN
jgi:hypothetical protein